MMKKAIEIIGINEDNCVNCHQCIAVCPVKICNNGSGDVIKFNNELCIGCGRCVEACIKCHGWVMEKSARFFIDDAPQFAADLGHKEIIALVAPSAPSNFNLNKLITALRLLGVKGVYDVSLGAEITIACYHEALQSGRAKTPFISTPCPAIVRFIELFHPQLLDYLAPVGTPVYNLAVYVHSLHPNAELAFISPCPAKRREFQDSQAVKYNITFQSLQRLFQENEIALEHLEDGEFDNDVAAGIAARFSTPGGLKESYLFHYPETLASSITKVAGQIVFKKYLDDLEKAIRNGDKPLPLIVDVLSCERGCNAGVGSINRSKTIDEIDYEVTSRSELATSDEKANQELKEFLNDIITKLDFSYNKYSDLSQSFLQIPDKSELKDIYAKMHKFEEKDFRNCAACGYNSCYQMAVAVFNGLNKAQNCHMYQEKELRIEQQALKNMHIELSNVFDTMSDGVLVLNQEGRISHFNPAAQNIIGYSDEALIGVYVVDLFCGKAPKTLRLYETGEPFNDREILIDGKRGKIHAAASGKPIFDEDKQVIGATIILKPIANVQQLVNKFTGAQATFTFNCIVGENKRLKKSIKLARMAGTKDSTVLLQAESGTGKEVFAQAIHNASQRKKGPFVAINCAALPRELVGSELFGYVEGAFTGARRGGRPGKFELANKGTLLLDEIGDMPLEQQGTLLRAIQEKAILRVGADSPINVDVRIIAATNKDLLKLVEQGRFRADLYYRLNVIQIRIPALRERPEDIELLFYHFLKDTSPKFNKYISEVDPRVIRYLENYHWPGNVRELQNTVERILLVAEDRITIEHLPQEIVQAVNSHPNEKRELEPNVNISSSAALSSRSMRKQNKIKQEQARILKALDDHAGNISKASLELGIARSTLYRKMKNYGIRN